MNGIAYLARLEELRRQHGATFRHGRGKLYVADAVLAKQVLGNGTGQFREHSDFFRAGTGTFGPRSAQIAIGRATRQLLQEHVRAEAARLPALVAQHLVPTSTWPDAGNRLVFAHTLRVLIGDQPSPRLAETVAAVVERAVLAGARDRYSRLTRARFRHRVMRVLAAEIANRRADRRSTTIDLLDVIAGAATVDSSDRDLAEVYLSALFAVVGSVGFLLGWSLYLLGTAGSNTEQANGPGHGREASSEPALSLRPAWVVREALRLWPVAWLFSRRPTGVSELGGTTVTPADDVLVCAYLVHRDPDEWTDPDEFRPSRWASVSGLEAFLPFGWGPHSCTGAAVTLHLVETLVELITSTYTLDVAVADSRPHVAAALAPPNFRLRLEPNPQPRGGEDHGEAVLRGQACAEHLRR